MSRKEAVRPALSRKNQVGLGLAAVLGLMDTSSVSDVLAPGSGEAGPPTSIIVADVVLGLITLVAVVYTWRTGNRTGSRVVAGCRILSAITALPALFVTGVPAWVVAVVAVFILVTVVTTGLVLSRTAPESALT
ncbi:hypothetical protein [Streptomyces sp. NPDC002265]|uniref:hypothetical protein n=1 Tax=Streptomyces sp. NPDC002265 TaxID=3154415 RepID=UPI003317F8A9